MGKKQPSSRPGGLSGRVKTAVFAAVEALIGEKPEELPSMGAIAERARINPTSLYRRWTDARTLVAAVAVERLMREVPMQDTGSIRGDLIAWGNGVARSLSTRRNVSMLRMM